ncbi:DNA replication/repair protein RecF [Leucobacter chromiiresistens]|uniref:DNA replication and repair protein RecF n=1 Tax=Leucobacter chromiiresistens TaxID=1079994 RepID=A0A1H0Y867_9MICO|nr:DNA replication/repair protein RecF [Leucobacter chromiiresistens]SDQ11365.1 DNA replication and repair protein RecF [Leucobacter chromiiresistens]
MRVAHLSLGDFRNYASAELGLSAGPNLLIGQNGQGKTNLVEAIAYFATLRSHRVSGDAALIRAGRSSAIARMRVRAGEREVRLELQLNQGSANRAQVNGNAVRPREVTRWFSAVTFAPEDLIIVRGEPSGRRRFLDDALLARHPVASGALSDYEKVVRQRTSLLKSARGRGQSALATLPVWDDQLVDHGTQIMLARRELLRDLSEPLRDHYAALVGGDHAPRVSMFESVGDARQSASVSRETPSDEDLVREADVSRETLAREFREALAIVRGREIERGVTLVGPHRDDLALALNGLPVKGFASHGESWSFALSLKLALAELLRNESTAGDPVIILDDVFAELDATRRGRLMRAVADYEQVIVTAAVEADVPDDVAWRRTRISAGTLEPDRTEETSESPDGA